MMNFEMPRNETPSVAYFDTNILSYLAKNQQLWATLSDFLSHNGMTIGIGEGLIAELSDATRLHTNLAELFVSVPTAILKTLEVVIEEEVEAHPERRSQSIINAIIDDSDHALLRTFLASKSLAVSREIQQGDAKQMQSRLLQLKSNFPPSKSGEYTREQAEEFTYPIVLQLLASTHRDFLIQVQQGMDFYSDVFLSIRLYALVIFYKYYLGQRAPQKSSDFGDLWHLFLLPYCKLAVMERDLCNVLNQIKRHHNVLDSTTVYNIEFLHQLASLDMK